MSYYTGKYRRTPVQRLRDVYWTPYIFIVIIVAFIAACVIGIVAENNHVNTLNNNFTSHCYAIGGKSVVITDKDLCLSSDGRVLDHQS